MKNVQFFDEARIEADVAELKSDDRPLFVFELTEALESIASGLATGPKVRSSPVRIWILPRLPYSLILR